MLHLVETKRLFLSCSSHAKPLHSIGDSSWEVSLETIMVQPRNSSRVHQPNIDEGEIEASSHQQTTAVAQLDILEHLMSTIALLQHTGQQILKILKSMPAKNDMERFIQMVDEVPLPTPSIRLIYVQSMT